MHSTGREAKTSVPLFGGQLSNHTVISEQRKRRYTIGVFPPYFPPENPLCFVRGKGPTAPTAEQRSSRPLDDKTSIDNITSSTGTQHGVRNYLLVTGRPFGTMPLTRRTRIDVLLCDGPRPLPDRREHRETHVETHLGFLAASPGGPVKTNVSACAPARRAPAGASVFVALSSRGRRRGESTRLRKVRSSLPFRRRDEAVYGGTGTGTGYLGGIARKHIRPPISVCINFFPPHLTLVT